MTTVITVSVYSDELGQQIDNTKTWNDGGKLLGAQLNQLTAQVDRLNQRRIDGPALPQPTLVNVANDIAARLFDVLEKSADNYYRSVAAQEVVSVSTVAQPTVQSSSATPVTP